ncbi:MAG: hypothetical protein KKD44_19280 [Proteobacteria bacterium]|nr:hypothetical protein [Pseudomonadota bacterium]
MREKELQQKMEKVLLHIVNFLEDSQESIYANESPKDLLKVANTNLKSVQISGRLSNPELMVNMFLPTASLQEIAIDNGWGSQYIELSKHFDMAFDACR